jgi:prophage regulatory protein
VIADSSTPDYLNSTNLYGMTGIPASTWRYWAMIGEGPKSFKIGRRRVWKMSTVLAWLADQEAADS